MTDGSKYSDLSQALGWAPGIQVKRERRDHMSKGDLDHDGETIETAWPELMGAHELWTATELAWDSEFGWWFWFVGWGLPVVPGLIPNAWTDFLEPVLYSGMPCSGLIWGEGLGPASTCYARLYWLPKGGFTPLRSGLGVGRGTVTWVGERERGRGIGVGMEIKKKVKIFTLLNDTFWNQVRGWKRRAIWEN